MLGIFPRRVRRRAKNARRDVELQFKRGIPRIRLYVNDRQVGQEPPSGALEKIVIRAAQAAGTAAASALVARLLDRARKPQE